MSKTRQVLGKVLITFEGEFNSSTEYEQLDVVTYQGSTYIAKQDTKGNLPTNTSYFALLVQKPIKGTDYFTEQEIEDIVSEITDDANSVFNQNVTEKTTAFNNNASSKTTTFDNHVTDKTTEFDTHVTSKTSDFDSHVTTKTTEFDSYVSDKITDFDSNAASKTTDFNDNATLKTTEFNNNADYLSNTLNKYKTIHNAMPKAEDEGSDITLNETADGVFMDILPEGNSSQEEITDNLFDNTWESGGIDGSTGTLNGDGQVRTKNYIRVFFNHLYSISRSISTSYMVFRFYDINFNYLGSQISSAGFITTNKSSNRMDVGVSDMTFTVINENVAYMKIADASNNLLTVYTLTTDAINLDYPSDIKVVTGENKIIDSGRNMLSLSSLTTQTINGINLLKNDDGSITLNGTSTKSFSIDFPIEIPLFKNKKYVFSKNRAFGGASYSLSLRNANTNVISGTSMDSGESWKQIILSIDAIAKYFRLFINNNISFTNHTIYPMLEIGDTPSSFIKYQGLNVYSISLGSLKLAGKGDYKDFIFKNEVGNPYYNENLTLNSWYKYKIFNKKVFDGSENWILSQADTDNYFYNLSQFNGVNTNSQNALCNNLQLNSILVTNTLKGIYGSGSGNYVRIRLENELSLSEFKSFLSNHNVELLYMLLTPEYELITNTVLIEQLENLNNNARSYGETTIISCGSDDDKNATLVTKSVAVKDLNTVLDNINNAILEIGGGE